MSDDNSKDATIEDNSNNVDGATADSSGDTCNSTVSNAEDIL